jgi:hypothetical protein
MSATKKTFGRPNWIILIPGISSIGKAELTKGKKVYITKTREEEIERECSRKEGSALARTTASVCTSGMDKMWTSR